MCCTCLNGKKKKKILFVGGSCRVIEVLALSGVNMLRLVFRKRRWNVLAMVEEDGCCVKMFSGNNDIRVCM